MTQTPAISVLVAPEYAPITFSIGFIEGEYTAVVDALQSWNQRFYRSCITVPHELQFPLSLGLVCPLTMPPTRELIVPAHSGWTAYFNNAIGGTDTLSAISYLVKTLGYRGVSCTSVPDTRNQRTGMVGTYGALKFEVFSPTSSELLNYERSINLVNDGGHWEFDVNGNVQPFEETQVYKARAKLKRFSTAMLVRYCQAFGIRVTDESFYRSSSVLFRLEPLPANRRTLSLADARYELGIVSDR